MQPTKEQKQALEGLGIDLSNIDWKKVGSFVILLLQMLMSQQQDKKGAKASKAASAPKALEGCSHQECCLETLKASLQATAAASHCYQTCTEQEDSGDESE